MVWRFLAVGGSLAAAFLSVIFIGLTPRSIDLTDSGYYLNSIKFAADYRYGADFGKVYQGLFVLLQGDWGLVRIFVYSLNAVLTFVLFWLLIDWLERFSSYSPSRIEKVLIISVGTFGSSFMLHWWLPTPNYNTLAFQGILIFSIALLLVLLYGWGHTWMMGLGVFTAFLGKPTTAAILVLLTLSLYFLMNKRRLSAIALAGSSFIAILFLWSLFQYGGLDQLFDRFAFTLASVSAVDAGHLGTPQNLSNAQFLWGKYSPFYRLTIPGAIGLGVFFIAFSILIVRGFLRSSQKWLDWSNLLLVLSSLAGFLLFARYQQRGSTAILTLAVPLSLALVTLVLRRVRKRVGNPIGNLEKNRAGFVLAAVFFLMPIALGFGTGNNFIQRGEAASVFYFAATLIVISLLQLRREDLGRKNHWSGQFLTTGLFLVSTSYVLVLSILNPYIENQSLFEMNQSDVIKGVYSSPEVETYLQELRATGLRLGISESTPVFDNTGGSPTAIYALGGFPLGSAWIQGGWPGSQELAELQIDLHSKECLSSTWVLDEPDTSLKVFGDFGIQLDPKGEYTLAGEFVHPVSGNRQFLYKPRSESPPVVDCHQTQWK
jgi:hypothetical protein